MARWWRRRAEPAATSVDVSKEAFTSSEVAEMDAARKASIAKAAALLDDDVEPMEVVQPEPVPTPEYDAGVVEVDALLEEGAAPTADHHDVNVVVHEDLDDLEDPLERALIDGDLPEPVDLE
jgi:hypothetical protein